MDVDLIQLNFTPESLTLLNWIIAIIMFGVALDIKLSDFKKVARSPRGPLIGLACQFFVFPCFAFLLTLILQPRPSISLGIILLAACPGGNFSNFLTHLSGGNAALSITMSSVSTLMSIVMTPFNIALWGSMNPATANILQSIQMDALSILKTVSTILILPLLLGLFFNHRFPAATTKLQKPFKYFGVIFMFAFIIIALNKNIDYFIKFVGMAAIIVFIMNSSALAIGYWFSRLLKLGKPEAKAVAFEVGIQNAGFGLILIFNFFNGLGGMAIIVAWWGVWHMVSGLSLALFWAKKLKISTKSTLSEASG